MTFKWGHGAKKRDVAVSPVFCSDIQSQLTAAGTPRIDEGKSVQRWGQSCLTSSSFNEQSSAASTSVVGHSLPDVIIIHYLHHTQTASLLEEAPVYLRCRHPAFGR